MVYSNDGATYSYNVKDNTQTIVIQPISMVALELTR